MVVQEGTEPEKDDFADFRTQVYGLVHDFEPCLRAPNVMMQVND